jgi:hypothetical protein
VQSFSGPARGGLGTKFYFLKLETPPTWRARSSYLNPPGNGWPSYTPRHWVTFSSSPTTRRTTVEVFDSASTRGTNWFKSSLMLRPKVSRQVCLGIKYWVAPFVFLITTLTDRAETPKGCIRYSISPNKLNDCFFTLRLLAESELFVFKNKISLKCKRNFRYTIG